MPCLQAKPTPLLERAHNRSLAVYPFTFRNEVRRTHLTELELAVAPMFDKVFGRPAAPRHWAPAGWRPQRPAFRASGARAPSLQGRYMAVDFAADLQQELDYFAGPFGMGVDGFYVDCTRTSAEWSLAR